MEVSFKTLTDIKGVKRGYYGDPIISAEVDFDNAEEVVQEIGIKTAVHAFEENDVYEELGGWEEAKEFFADEIQELIDEKVKEALEAKENR